MIMTLKNILLVALGGGVGSVARFCCQYFLHKWYPSSFPVGTFLVNITGCFLIGLFMGSRSITLSPEWRVLLVTGLCGGFTTFSSFAYENVQLLKSGSITTFLLYTAGSVVLGILATLGGMALMKAI